jgi:hypothetical protein
MPNQSWLAEPVQGASQQLLLLGLLLLLLLLVGSHAAALLPAWVSQWCSEHVRGPGARHPRPSSGLLMARQRNRKI